MSASTPPPPTTGNGKYVVIILLFLVGIGALVIWKTSQKPRPQVVTTIAPPPSTPTANARLDDVPPPPDAPDAGKEDAGPAVTRALQTYGACEVKSCSGSITPELEQALAYRAKTAHKCYDAALSQDNSLQGKVQISVRIAANGNVCNAGVVSSDTGLSGVASCVAGFFRGSHFPNPKSGCVDTAVPLNFVPGGR